MFEARWIGLTLLLVVSAGCGFKLRQAEPLPVLLQSVRIEATDPRGQVARELARLLEQGGAELGATAATRLRILAEAQERQVLAVDERARVSEFELKLVVLWQVEDAAGVMLLQPTQVELSRNYAFDALAAIGAAEEEELIRRELAEDAARQILLQASRALVQSGSAQSVPAQ